MNCPGCGAGVSRPMLEAGECGYCHTALPKAPEAPKVVHVTKVEVHGPTVHVAGLFDSIAARVAGCFSGCLSMGFTLLVMGMILAYVGWQLWVTMPRPAPPPGPTPVAPAPAPPAAPSHPGTDRPRRRR